MSVLVKGMKMPDNCEQCAFQSDVGFCLAMPKNFCGYTETDKRSDFCPLVALPDHHGRLVDADALEKILEKIPAADIKNMGGQAYVLVKLSQVFNVIDNQPTIEPRKKGKWIDCDGGIATCSICGDRWGVYGVMNFCPNCGAEMGKQDD